jgi:hypothetical protein
MLCVERSLQNDLSYGFSKENDVLEKCKQFFNEEIVKSKEKYCKFDGESDRAYYEIKSRRCKSDTYPTTIIPVHKIQDYSKDLIFVFNFTDGIYYIAFDKDKFANFKTDIIQVYRRGINDKPTMHYFIPTNELIPIQI